MEDFVLPATNIIIFIIAVAGICSWGVTQMLKFSLNGLEKKGKITIDDWWHRPLLRLVSIISGGITGFLVASTAGALLGVGAGVLNATLFVLVRNFVKNKAQALSGGDKPENKDE